MFVCLSSPDETVKKLPHDLRFTVMADCIRIGNKASEAVTEAQFTSTFSNRVFSKNKSVTITCNDGKIKFNLP